jgi:signal transduction histidine kinase
MLGVLAGVLAAVATLPTILPLSRQVMAAEDASNLARVMAAATATAELIDADVALAQGLHRGLGVDGVRVAIDAEGTDRFRSGNLPLHLPLASLCPPGEAPTRIVHDADARWGIACLDVGPVRVVAALRERDDDHVNLAMLVVALAAIVGISAAFGVMQILSPLSEITRALDRLRSGERDVVLAATGIREIDLLVSHLNAASRAVDDRERAIQDRVEVAQRMLGYVSHEVRNPLQSLEFLASLIAVEEDGAERARLANTIRDEVRSLDAIIGRFVADRRTGDLRLNRQATPIGDVVEEVVTFRRPSATHLNIALDVDLATHRAVFVDRPLLGRALENVVANALSMLEAESRPAGSAGGRIRVSTREVEDMLEIIVEDDGPGVPPELGDRIYEPHVGQRPGGSGLGLSFVRDILAAHGGYVRHDPPGAPGRVLPGARFVLGLPISEPMEEDGADPGGR